MEVRVIKKVFLLRSTLLLEEKEERWVENQQVLNDLILKVIQGLTYGGSFNFLVMTIFEGMKRY